jgi:hypothetical protein
MRGHPITNRQREKMRSLRAERMPLEDIAAVVGVGLRCVCEHTRDMGIASERPGRAGRGGKRTDAQNARLLAASRSGLSHEEIGARFRLKPKSVAPTLSRLRRRVLEQQA